MSFVERLFPRSRATGATTAAVGSNGSVGGRVGSTPALPTPVAAGRTQAPVDPKLRELQLRRTHLAEQLAERQWDLGGLTYEMAIRDHFRMDVLIKLAADLQEIDAELAEVERLLRLESSVASGECPTCRAPHSRGAVYCWSCGAQLMPTETSKLIA